MGKIRRFGVTLEPPVRGWLPVRLQLDDFVIDCKASNVGTDPVADLIRAAACCTAPAGGSQRVLLWLEPEAYAIDLAVDASSHRCELQVSYTEGVIPEFVPPMAMKSLFRGVADSDLVRDTLVSGLADLIGQAGAASLDTWRPGQSYAADLVSVRRGPPVS